MEYHWHNHNISEASLRKYKATIHQYAAETYRFDYPYAQLELVKDYYLKYCCYDSKWRKEYWVKETEKRLKDIEKCAYKYGWTFVEENMLGQGWFEWMYYKIEEDLLN